MLAKMTRHNAKSELLVVTIGPAMANSIKIDALSTDNLENVGIPGNDIPIAYQNCYDIRSRRPCLSRLSTIASPPNNIPR